MKWSHPGWVLGFCAESGQSQHNAIKLLSGFPPERQTSINMDMAHAGLSILMQVLYILFCHVPNLVDLF